jgi:hypothetical protein
MARLMQAHAGTGMSANFGAGFFSNFSWLAGRTVSSARFWPAARQGCGTLDDKKERRLESLGVRWNMKPKEFFDEVSFDRNFDLLLAFKEREGHVRVPLKHQESATAILGKWLGRQRSRHRRGHLDLDRQNWLEMAGVTWEKRETGGTQTSSACSSEEGGRVGSPSTSDQNLPSINVNRDMVVVDVVMEAAYPHPHETCHPSRRLHYAQVQQGYSFQEKRQGWPVAATARQ